jgi:hypothetical protein
MKQYNNDVVTVAFTNFGRPAVGRVVTEEGSYAFVNSRNPYGGHNLMVVDLVEEEAVAHGVEAVLREAFYSSKKTYRKVRRFLSIKRPDTISWFISN